jgi:hypothetical protein
MTDALKSKIASAHKRNTGPMLTSLRCGAKTRAGTPCNSPAVRGKQRCRMHGGAKGSGAPRGNQNALKHGLYTREELEFQRKVRDMLKGFNNLVEGH